MTNKNDLFLKLLKQVRFPDTFEDNDLLQKGKIENVDVYAKEHRWDIHVFFDTPLRYDTYVALRKAIEETFASFVNVNFFVSTADGLDQYLPDYWKYAVQNSDRLQPMAREFLADQKPKKVDGRWIIQIDNNIIDGMIEQSTLDGLAEEMRNYGFFNLKFITQLDQTSLQNSMQSLQEFIKNMRKTCKSSMKILLINPNPNRKLSNIQLSVPVMVNAS